MIDSLNSEVDRVSDWFSENAEKPSLHRSIEKPVWLFPDNVVRQDRLANRIKSDTEHAADSLMAA